MNLDNYTIYGFIRQDLPPGQETVQAIHAAFRAGLEFAALNSVTFDEATMEFIASDGPVTGIERVICADTPTLKSVKKAKAKLDTNLLDYHAMLDTDIDPEISAVITHPLNDEERKVLAEYRLRRYTGSVAATAKTDLSVSSPPNTPVAQAHLGNQGGRANSNADLAQLRERSVSNGGVAGENPAVSSKHLACS